MISSIIKKKKARIVAAVMAISMVLGMGPVPSVYAGSGDQLSAEDVSVLYNGTDDFWSYNREPYKVTLTYRDKTYSDYPWEVSSQLRRDYPESDIESHPEYYPESEEQDVPSIEAGGKYRMKFVFCIDSDTIESEPYELKVIDNPITKIEAKPDVLNIFEGDRLRDEHGYDYYDEEEGHDVHLDVDWKRYDIWPEDIVITYDLGEGEQVLDSRTFSNMDTHRAIDSFIEMLEIENLRVDYWVETDQTPTNTWQVGNTYNATLSVANIRDEFSVKINEFPIDEVIISDIKRYEGDTDYRNEDWIDGERIIVDWEAYNIWPEQMTVKFKEELGLDDITGDGNFVRDELCRLFETDNFEYCDQHDQHWDNIWGVGTHKAEFNIFGKIYEYNVIIQKSPVKSVSVEDFQVFEGDTETRRSWDNDKQEDVTYQAYRTWPAKISVELDPEMVPDEAELENYIISGEPEQVRRELGRIFQLDEKDVSLMDFSDQDFNNLWENGEHTLHFKAMGATGDYKITIIDNPITNVTVDDKTVYVGDKSCNDWGYDYINDEGEYIHEDIEWNRYDTWPRNVKVSIGNEVLEGFPNDVADEISERYGVRMTCEDDRGKQSPHTEWEAGDHDAVFNIAGNKIGYTVTLVEPPIYSIEVSEAYVLAGSTYKEHYGDREFDRYGYWPEHLKVFITKDSDPIEGDTHAVLDEVAKQLEIDRNSLMLDQNDNQEKEAWEVGEHVVIYSLCGITAKAKVIVVPFEWNIAVEDMNIYDNDVTYPGGYFILRDDGGEEFKEDNDFIGYSTNPEKIKVWLGDDEENALSVNPYDFREEVIDAYLSDHNDWNRDFLSRSFNVGWYNDQSPDNAWEIGSVNDCSFQFGSAMAEYKASIICDHLNDKGESEVSHTDVVAATCETDGKEEYYQCSTCRQKYSDQECTNAVTDDDLKIDALQHSYNYNEVAHWAWADDYSSVKAQFACTRSGCEAVDEYDASFITDIDPEPVCGVTKDVKYTATLVKNSKTFTDEVIRTVSKSHNMVYKNFKWNGTSAKVVTKCSECNIEVETDATVTSRLLSAATCTTSGSKLYIASATVEGELKTDSKTVTIDPLGHDYVYLLMDWSEDNKSAEADFLCTCCGDIKRIGAEISVDESEKETKKIIKYTASVLYDGVTYTDTKTVEVEDEIYTGVVVNEVDRENLPFKDISFRNWGINPMIFVFERGIMTGISGTLEEGNVLFLPDGTLTRGMFVTILYKMENKPSVKFEDVFDDVKNNGKYYVPAIMWAYQNGVVNGKGPRKFDPDGEITRQELAAMFIKYAKYKKVYNADKLADLSSFADCNDVSAWATESMRWAVGNGIITGTKEGTLKPLANATRQECSAMIQRYITTFGY